MGSPGGPGPPPLLGGSGGLDPPVSGGPSLPGGSGESSQHCWVGAMYGCPAYPGNCECSNSLCSSPSASSVIAKSCQKSGSTKSPSISKTIDPML
ncbi:MAG: hypothetical protein E6Q97_30855 [Desulfurellales bacterium]|nr:MAG: hypothetical protein E6Q97_30855 [Desulfurellales bacterium]